MISEEDKIYNNLYKNTLEFTLKHKESSYTFEFIDWNVNLWLKHHKYK